ncbi:MAG: winged helix-turn-helix transcriptional regulator [Rhodospirillaceae bacterium]|nr:winged helix-turn-helix transcriptional regulator [Rhodospirillaceae bacterium]
MGAAARKRSRRPESDGTRPSLAGPPPALMTDGTGGRFRQLVNDLFTIAVRMDAVRARFSQLVGVTPPQYSILMTVAQLEEEGGGGATVRRVAELTHVSGAFVTAETGKLVRMGLLDKRPNPADGRSVLVTLTPKGTKALDAALPHIRAVNEAFFGRLTPDEFKQLSASAARIVEASASAVLLAHALSAAAQNP